MKTINIDENILNKINPDIDNKNAVKLQNELNKLLDNNELNEIQKNTDEEIKKVIEIINDSPIFKEKIEFSFNYEFNTPIIQVFDREKKEIIREFPSEEFFKNLKYFQDNILKGLILNKKT
jgi:uncharacterized FlaG/YvyC family protein